MSENQRQHERHEIEIQVELSFLEDSPCTVITRDVSDGGLFMRISDIKRYPMGEMVNLKFKDPMHDFMETTKDAIIIRCTDDGIAVAFIEMEEF